MSVNGHDKEQKDSLIDNDVTIVYGYIMLCTQYKACTYCTVIDKDYAVQVAQESRWSIKWYRKYLHFLLLVVLLVRHGGPLLEDELNNRKNKLLYNENQI